MINGTSRFTISSASMKKKKIEYVHDGMATQSIATPNCISWRNIIMQIANALKVIVIEITVEMD